MEKRQRSVSLSFVLFRFGCVMLGSMALCCALWLAVVTALEHVGAVYRGSVSNQQLEQFLSENPETFVPPGRDFLPEYALFGPDGETLQSSVKGKRLSRLKEYLRKQPKEVSFARHVYQDGSTGVFHWHFRKEFKNPALRGSLPPFETLWMATLGGALVLCLVFNTLRLRGKLAEKLSLFREVSERIGAQELDFEIPKAGIREYDQALGAMEDMRKALYDSLSSQWAARQEREAEISSLAHDLKTPLTLVEGNAELLLEEELSAENRKAVETILSSSLRARRYVASLLETASGAEEAFEAVSLSRLFEKLFQNVKDMAASKKVSLELEDNLAGSARLQGERLLRAFTNVAVNAIEHTEEGSVVSIEGSMTKQGWKIKIQDEGEGFTKAALCHGTERLWRDDKARGGEKHNGLGLWFAAGVVEKHGGRLTLENTPSGGCVSMEFPKMS